MDDPFGHSMLILLCLLLAAVVRVTAAALPYIDEADTQRQADDGDAHARRALRLNGLYEESPFGAFQMTYIALLLAGGMAAWSAFSGRLLPLMAGLPAFGAKLAAGACAFIPYALLAFLFTGVIPGHLAAHWRERALDRAAPVADWALRAFSPLYRLALALGRAALRPFHIKPADAGDHVTEEDIRAMVDIGEEKGAIESDEKEMIENIFEFNNMDAGDCMIHRKDITAVPIDAEDADILETIRESGLSRFPVYEDSIDNVLGILTTRDYLMDRCAGGETPLRQLIRPAHFVPESVRTDVLFQEMQKHKHHMAIVVDEYGGTSGLITLEDLLEEIVGNIYDEFDPKEEPDIVPLAENRWRVRGSIELEQLAEALDIELPEDEEYDTLGGLIFSRLTEIPADGQHPEVSCFGLRIRVEELAERRVEWALVEKLPPDAEPAPAED